MSTAKHAEARPTLAKVVEGLEALIGGEHVSQEYVRLRIDLVKAQREVCAALSAAPRVAEPDAARRAAGNGSRSAAGGPVLEPQAITFDAAPLKSLFAAVRAALERHGTQGADVARLAAAAAREPELLTTLTRKAACGPDRAYLESLARRLEANAVVLLFVGRTLAAPFVGTARDVAAPRRAPGAPVQEAAGMCPYCASPPALARLRRDDGRRIVDCPLCGESWAFRRLACPFCGNCAHADLRFLRVAEQDPRWIETCEQCRNYIKTIDERRLGVGEPVIPLVEEVATLHLDLLADREGYLRCLPYTACC